MYSTKEMRRFYHEEKYSIRQVADILGCKPSLVASRLDNELRTREEAGRIRTIRSYFGYFPASFK